MKDIDKIIDLTESEYNEYKKLIETVFNKKHSDKIFSYIDRSDSMIVKRVNENIKQQIITELKQENVDGISIFIGLFSMFVSYYDELINFS